MLSSSFGPPNLLSGATGSRGSTSKDIPFALVEALGLSRTEAISFFYHYCEDGPRPSLEYLSQHLSRSE